MPLEKNMGTVVVVSAFKKEAIYPFCQQFIPKLLHEGRTYA